jgi:signal peptidase I
MVNFSSSDLLELSNEILGRGDHLRFRARGSSMLPFIRNGEIVEVEPVDIGQIRVGDVVFYRTWSGRILAHRVIEKRKGEKGVVLVTKGDAVPRPDVLVYPDQVLGRVMAVERSGRNIRFDNGLHRLVGVLYARVSPFSSWIYPILGRVKRAMRYLWPNRLNSMP